MSYKSLRDCANDLEKTGQLIRIKEEVDPNLEMAAIHLRVYAAQGPALLFENVKGSPFQAISNIYGTHERTEYIFRNTIEQVKRVSDLKIDPLLLLKHPMKYLGAPWTALTALPRKSIFSAPILHGTTSIDQLPQIKSWPMDGGAFVTLPQVFTLPPGSKNMMESNLGMYRIQLSGNDYIQNEEVGLHYQLHRGIGVHHTAYNDSDEPFRASIFIGGPPSHAFSAIMPMPEGLSELTFAGMLAGRRFRYTNKEGHVLSSDADFVITGTIVKNKKKKEGPFGDHLGYYSLDHDFPVMKVDKVYHRKDPLWHFTVVGRPPQEDSSFGHLIHLMVNELTKAEFPGIQNIHAVDVAGVHPLLLAVGSERYMPFRPEVPEEILTQANHILGSGQTSLAKFLIIADQGKHSNLHSRETSGFLKHVFERIDWNRDLHFYTNTTIDTLDYSGSDWNSGSKVVMACRGPKLRTLATEFSSSLNEESAICFPGVLAVKQEKFTTKEKTEADIAKLVDQWKMKHGAEERIAMIVLVDDVHFTSKELSNFIWVTFTRINPSHDIYGVDSYIENKHWGCRGPLIMDARKKPHHAPELEEDPEIAESVERFFKKGAVLEKWS